MPVRWTHEDLRGAQAPRITCADVGADEHRQAGQQGAVRDTVRIQQPTVGGCVTGLAGVELFGRRQRQRNIGSQNPHRDLGAVRESRGLRLVERV